MSQTLLDKPRTQEQVITAATLAEHQPLTILSPAGAVRTRLVGSLAEALPGRTVVFSHNFLGEWGEAAAVFDLSGGTQGLAALLWSNPKCLVLDLSRVAGPQVLPLLADCLVAVAASDQPVTIIIDDIEIWGDEQGEDALLTAMIGGPRLTWITVAQTLLELEESSPGWWLINHTHTWLMLGGGDVERWQLAHLAARRGLDEAQVHYLEGASPERGWLKLGDELRAVQLADCATGGLCLALLAICRAEACPCSKLRGGEQFKRST